MKKYTVLLFLLLIALSLRAQIPTFETSFQAVRNMGVGWNLGNTLDSHAIGVTDVTQTETMRGQAVTTPELMEMLKQAGFGTVRVPVTWYPHLDANGNIDPAWMARVKQVVDYVLAQDMYCIINVHHDTGKTDPNSGKAWLRADMTNYENNKAVFKKIWQQIAETFINYGERLLFEGFNEMLDPIDSWDYASSKAPEGYDETIATSAYNAINNYASDFVTTVRSTGGRNAQRNLILNTYACAYSSEATSKLQNPEPNKRHIIFGVHAYPRIVNVDEQGNRTERPMSEVEDLMDVIMNNLNTNLVSKGGPVIIGEWGTSNVDANPTDYAANRTHMFNFVDLFLSRVKANNMAAMFWMGVTNGSVRGIPAFNQADLADRMLKAWHGSSHTAPLPVESDFNTEQQIEFTRQYSEVNLAYDASGLNNKYTRIELTLAQLPNTNGGNLSFRVYKSDGQYVNCDNITSLNQTLYFNNVSASYKPIQRITLVWRSPGSCRLRLLKAQLVNGNTGQRKTLTLTNRTNVTITTRYMPKDGSKDNYATVGDFTYLVDNTSLTAKVVKCNNPNISGTITLNTISWDGRTYTVTEVGDNVFAVEGSAGDKFNNLTAVSLPNVKTVGNHVFVAGGTGAARFDKLTTINLPEATTIGNYVLSRTGGDGVDLSELTTINMPKVTAIGDNVLHSTLTDFGSKLTTVSLPALTTLTGSNVLSANSSFNALTTLNLPALKTITGSNNFYGTKSFPALTTLNLNGLEAVSGNNVFSDGGARDAFMGLKSIYLSMACNVSGTKCFGGGGKPIYHIADAHVIYPAGNNSFQSRFDRFIVPPGKASLIIAKWLSNGSFNHEIYTPVTLSKTGSGYSTMTIPGTSEAASCTYEGTTYPNHYNFNHALSKEVCYTNPTYSSIYNASNYPYTWYAATEVNDGTVTVSAPSTSSKRMGIAPDEGFLLKGPAFTGTGDDIIYLPVHTSRAKYEGTNYFKAGTGTAIPKESNDCYNFYFSASMQQFYPCNNTVIPVGRAYLSLPKSLVADAKQIKYVVDDGDDVATGINDTWLQKPADTDTGWFTLDGRRLNSRPTQRGVYLHNGRKEVVR